MSFSKAIDPDHDISDHHYYDNYTIYSYHCSNYCSNPTTITVANIYIKQCLTYIAMSCMYWLIIMTHIHRSYVAIVKLIHFYVSFSCRCMQLCQCVYVSCFSANAYYNHFGANICKAIMQ